MQCALHTEHNTWWERQSHSQHENRPHTLYATHFRNFNQMIPTTTLVQKIYIQINIIKYSDKPPPLWWYAELNRHCLCILFYTMPFFSLHFCFHLFSHSLFCWLSFSCRILASWMRFVRFCSSVFVCFCSPFLEFNVHKSTKIMAIK